MAGNIAVPPANEGLREWATTFQLSTILLCFETKKQKFKAFGNTDKKILTNFTS